MNYKMYVLLLQTSAVRLRKTLRALLGEEFYGIVTQSDIANSGQVKLGNLESLKTEWSPCNLHQAVVYCSDAHSCDFFVVSLYVFVAVVSVSVCSFLARSR